MSKSCLSPTISPSVVDGDGAIRDSLPRHDGTVPRQLDLAVDGQRGDRLSSSPQVVLSLTKNALEPRRVPVTTGRR